MKGWVSPFAVPNETRPRFPFPDNHHGPANTKSAALPRQLRPAAAGTTDNGHRTERTGLEQGLNTTGVVPKGGNE